MAGNVQEKQLRWYNIALMSFITVWGFGNVVNNYANQGLVVVFSWVFIFALYFTPYALIVGQLGSTFKDGKGGVSTWIKHTMGPGLAYLAAWTYWVVHIPYLAQKPQAILIALGWAMKGDGSLIKEYSVVALQGLTLVLFIFFMWVASRGMKSLKIVGSVAGIAMFVMSLLYVAMAVTAPAITEVHIATTNITWETFIPHDLLNHQCVVFRYPSGKPFHWQFAKELEIAVAGNIILDDVDAELEAVLMGAGIGYLLYEQIKEYLDTGRLECVLEDWSTERPGFQIYYPNRQYMSCGLRAFLDYVKTGQICQSQRHRPQ